MTFEIRYETIEDDFIVQEIVNNTFGPGRFAKTAYRIREDNLFQPLFGLVTENHLKKIVATVRVAYLNKNTKETAFLGPIAVQSDSRNLGLGMSLMKEAILEAKIYNVKKIILIGDPNYYCKFGFFEADKSEFKIKYPIDTKRILVYHF
jgi:predicted N-acetyltransferase YhbS